MLILVRVSEFAMRRGAAQRGPLGTSDEDVLHFYSRLPLLDRIYVPVGVVWCPSLFTFAPMEAPRVILPCLIGTHILRGLMTLTARQTSYRP